MIVIYVLGAWNDLKHLVFQAGSPTQPTKNPSPNAGVSHGGGGWHSGAFPMDGVWLPQKIHGLLMQCWMSISFRHPHLTGQQQLSVSTQTLHSNVRMSYRNGRGWLEHAPRKYEYPKCWVETLLELKNKPPSHQHSHNLAAFLSPPCFFLHLPSHPPLHRVERRPVLDWNNGFHHLRHHPGHRCGIGPGVTGNPETDGIPLYS